MQGCGRPVWRWLLRNVNKSLKINILLNFCHSRLFVQLFFFSKQCFRANPGKISTFTFLLIWFLGSLWAIFLTVYLKEQEVYKTSFILIFSPGCSPHSFVFQPRWNPPRNLRKSLVCFVKSFKNMKSKLLTLSGWTFYDTFVPKIMQVILFHFSKKKLKGEKRNTWLLM